MMAGIPLAQALARTRDLELACRAASTRGRELEQLNERLTRGYQQCLERAADLKRSNRRLERAAFQLLLGVVRVVEARHEDTRGHSERVGAMAWRLALRIGLTRAQARTVAHAGRLHDLGKVGLPEAVLLKCGELDTGERTVVRRHPVLGAHLVSPFESLAEAAVIIRHHHERYDGGGYPDGLRGDMIPLGARIVAVADRFDALLSRRPHRPALALDAAIGRLRTEAGAGLDPGLTQMFVRLAEADEVGPSVDPPPC
jgi:response regulator RpfG family c-di-GMP phosphodiesterase